MTSGYGAGTINILRQLDSKSFCEQPSLLSALKLTTEGTVIEFPLTLGRDFAGVVAEVGADVTDFRIGDEVFGAVGVQRNGSHADFVVVSADMVSFKKYLFLSLIHCHDSTLLEFSNDSGTEKTTSI